ncbi:MAG: nuclear transport factor 2 family protein [Candidatus Sumerlaeia bacterium]|nr:nuclear transport factor 2 family protein [Candidatus Sumerlaeia bacterium]
MFNELNWDNIDLVEELYTPDVYFNDPIHELKGIDELTRYYIRLYDGVEKCHFHWHDEVANDGQGMIAWTMVMSHKRFRKGETLEMPGVSHLRFREGKVAWHRDYFDMGRMIYERVPLLGGVIRRIKKRLQ